MSIVLAFAFAFSGTPDVARTGSRDAWFGPDKVKHFFASAFVQSVGYGALRTAGASHDGALGGATLVTLAVGVGKEVHDHRVGKPFSTRDLTWDAAGAGASTALLSHATR